MKILYLQHEEKLWGTARSLLALIDELRQQDHECYVLLHKDGPMQKELDERQVPHTTCHWRTWTADERKRKSLRTVHGLRCLLHSHFICSNVLYQIRDFKPDLVHSNTTKANLGGCLSRQLGIPHIWHMREFVGSRYGVGTEWSLGRWATTKYMSRYGEAAICTSQSLRQAFTHPSLRIPIHTVYNGVMTRAQMLHAVSPLPPTETGVHFAFIGRFDDLKDPLVTLRAIAILQGRGIACKLLMVGDGSPEQQQMLQHFVREHRLQGWIEFLGFVSDVSACLKRIHVLLMPSRGDAFGRVTAEAMAHGRPVIGANACATPELVRDGIDGLIFTLGHAEELADKMQVLIENPAKMAEMGRNAAQRAQAEFTNEQYAAAVMNIYERVRHGGSAA